MKQESLFRLTRDSNCEKCPNWESAEQVCMWGKGPKSPQVMIIGEAPSDLDDRQGRHFQGSSGKLLDQLLEAAGLTRSECYLTYVVKCHPPEGRAPSASEIKECRAYLEEEISTVRPKFIVTLGATALKAINKKSKITELHGQPFDYHGITVVPTFAPAMALRDPAKLPQLRKDMVKLGHIIAGNMPTEEEMHWKVIRSLKDWNEFIKEFEASEEFSADCETTGLDEHAEFHSLGPEYGPAGINSIQFGLDNDRSWSLPLIAKDSPWREKPDLQQMFMETVTKLSEGKPCIGQNFKFDNRWIKKKYGVKFKLGFDTMLAHHLLDENSPHGLKEMASEFCNAPTYDIPLRVKLGNWNSEAEKVQFYKYGCFDTHYTLELYYKFKQMLLREPGLRRLFYKLVMPAARMFEEIEEDGHYINLKAQKKLKKELQLRLIDVTSRMDKMLRAAGVRKKISWDSPAQIGEAFYKHMKMPILEKTGKGKPSTAETVLLRLAETEPLAKLLMERRGIAKNLSTYVEGWEKLMHGDRLFLSTKLHGTVTGRYASRLHQVPRDPIIRSLIDAPDGWTFVSADYSQIELRLAAMLSGDKRLLMTYQTGGDAHAETASGLMGKSPADLTKEERKQAKPVNFGFLYGMGWPKFIIYARDNYGVTFTEAQAQAYRKRYFEMYNALPAWHERQRRCVRVFGQVTSLSGRIRHLPGINSSEKGVRAECERQGINSPVQGFGSGDLKAMAMVEIHKKFSREHVRIKGEVHDSILMWVRTDMLDELIPQIKEIMEAPELLAEFGINMTVPLVADFEVGAWGMGEKYEVKPRTCRRRRKTRSTHE